MTWIRRVRLAAAGAVALTAITVATAGATGATDRTADAAPRTPAPGFLWDKGRYTTIDVPGSMYAITNDINDLGQIVGAYRTPPTTVPLR